MYYRLRACGLLWPTLMTLVALPILLGLGTWQLQRKSWKEGLQRQIDARRVAEPTTLDDTIQRYRRGEDVEYLRVRLVGRFDHVNERLFYAPEPSGLSWRVFTSFIPQDGPPLFVNRGLVPDRLRPFEARAPGQISGETTVIGLVRLAEQPGWFTPLNDANGNLWYWRDLDAMRWGASGPPPPEQLARMKLAWMPPFSIDAEAKPANPGGWPKGGTTVLKLSNRHLEYAGTWYGLALTLIGVFFVYARGRLKAPDITAPPPS